MWIYSTGGLNNLPLSYCNKENIRLFLLWLLLFVFHKRQSLETLQQKNQRKCFGFALCFDFTLFCFDCLLPLLSVYDHLPWSPPLVLYTNPPIEVFPCHPFSGLKMSVLRELCKYNQSWKIFSIIFLPSVLHASFPPPPPMYKHSLKNQS